MKAFQITQFGLEHLEQVDLPEPKPGTREVLVRIHAASLNYRDLMMVRGHYNPRLPLPRIPLSDGAGQVVALGDGVQHVRVGDRVAGVILQHWYDGQPSIEKSRCALADDLDGVLAEYIVLPQDGIVPIPGHLSYEEAATLPCAALTAWNALTEATHLNPGNTVLIQGTGGVSIFALQFAKLLGARVLGISSSDEKLEGARMLGLDAGLNYKQTPEWSKWVKDHTGGEGVDLIVEVGGSATLNESMKSIRIGGTIAQIGVLSGIEEKLSIVRILMRQIRIAGIFVGSRRMFEDMNRAISLHELHPVVGKVFPFLETLEAYRYMEEAGHFGKIVIAI